MCMMTDVDWCRLMWMTDIDDWCRCCWQVGCADLWCRHRRTTSLPFSNATILCTICCCRWPKPHRDSPSVRLVHWWWRIEWWLVMMISDDDADDRSQHTFLLESHPMLYDFPGCRYEHDPTLFVVNTYVCCFGRHHDWISAGPSWW